MKIGERIKSIRTSKCITQKQLAGDHITRNMLSRIENGVAMPSVPTIIFLADKLNVPVGFLLSDEKEEHVYRKINNIDNVKRAYIDEDYRICRDICLSIDCNDDELNLILSKCDYEIAKEEFRAGRLRSAVKYFDEAIDYCGKTIYSNEIIAAEASVYYRYMRRISPTLGGDIDFFGENKEILSNTNRFCTYVFELEKLDKDEINTIYDLALDGVNLEDPLTAHIFALKCMKSSDYQKAFETLNSILKSQALVPDPVLCDVFGSLEICAKEIEDYKSAYEYASDRMNLLERMLSEADV